MMRHDPEILDFHFLHLHTKSAKCILIEKIFAIKIPIYWIPIHLVFIIDLFLLFLILQVRSQSRYSKNKIIGAFSDMS